MQYKINKNELVSRVNSLSPEERDSITNNPDYIGDKGFKYSKIGSIIPIIAAAGITGTTDNTIDDIDPALLTGATLASTGTGYLLGRQVATQRVQDIKNYNNILQAQEAKRLQKYYEQKPII